MAESMDRGVVDEMYAVAAEQILTTCMLFDSSDDEDDSRCYDDQMCQFVAAFLAREKRARVLNYAEDVVTAMTPEEFARHFRLTVGTFEYILAQIHEGLLPKGPGGALQAISPIKQLLVFLWYLANQDSMREIAVLFGISDSTVHKIVHTVSDSFCKSRRKYIKWPSRERRQNISAAFKDISGFEGIVGAIDGCHIKIMNQPGGDPAYINRKKFPSIQLQVIADDMMLMTNTNVGWPGSAHDARVFRNSGFATEAENGRLFSNGQFIVADSAYPLRPYLMTVFKDNCRLTRQQKGFNRRISSCRQVVERAFGLMKGRFRRLREVYCVTVGSICKLITSACILHNMCILADDEVQIYVEEVEEVNQYNNIYHNADAGTQLRNRLVESVQN